MRELQKAAQTAQTTDSPDRIDFYFRKEWRVLALITVSGLIYNLGLLAGPWFERRMTGCLIQILNGSSTAAQMLTLVCAYILSIAVVQGSRYIKRFYAWRFANNVNRKNRRAVSRTSGCVPETLHNIRTIHVLGKEPYMENRYDQYIRDSYRAMEKTNFYDAVYSPVILIFNAVVVAVVMLLSASGNPKVLTLFGYVEQSFHQVPGTVKDQITLF